MREQRDQSSRHAKSILAAASMATLTALSGCATAPQAPPEAPIAVQLKGTPGEVQEFLEERVRSKGIYRVENASDRAITFKTDCINLPDMGAFKCSLIMMAVGNSGWSGPYSVMTFRTNQLRDKVSLTAEAQWCATNAFGKTNCMPNGNASHTNALLRELESAYNAKAS